MWEKYGYDMDHKKKDIVLKLGVAAHDFIPRTLEAKVRRSEVYIHVLTCFVHGHFRLH